MTGSDVVRALASRFEPPSLPAVSIGTRVRLHAVVDDDIPEGALGTVVDVYAADDDVIVVVADLRPRCRLLYPWPEFVREAVVVSELSGGR